MADYVITVSVPFSFQGEDGGLVNVGLSYVVDAIDGSSQGTPEGVEITIDKK